MKPAGFLLLVPAAVFNFAEAAEAPAGLVSPQLKAHIRESLPTYQPPSAGKPAEGDGSPIFSESHVPDPDVLVLPKFMIREKRLPPDAADHLMSRADFDRKMRHLYEDDLSKTGNLDYFLNRFTLPLLSPSRAEKGKAIALGQEIDRLADLMSPEEAKGLRGFYDQIAKTVGRRAPKRR